MIEREIAEIRRRIRPEKNNIGHIRGCYVNDKHAIISEIDQMLGMISNDEAEELLSLLRKTLSGSIGRNLIDISFSNSQVLEGEEHKLLSSLRESSLSDDNAVNTFFQNVIESLELDGSYFIILANDKYDVFKKGADGEDSESSEVFSYILCAICPIKAVKPTLSYNIQESKFKNFIRDSIIGAPELGFMFPTFDARATNIYNAMLYTRDISETYSSFVEKIFKTETQKPATEQTADIASIMNDTISNECDIELVQSIQAQLIELTEDHKANKEEETLALNSKDMGTLLRFGGINEDSIKAFSERFEEGFGASTTITPANIMDIKKFEVKTPEVTVKVSPEHSELIQTKVIDGTKYILIRADGDIEVNGIRININE